MMGDAGEGLIDAESRIQERMDELAQERSKARAQPEIDAGRMRELGSLKLARTELERQLQATTNDRRRAQLQQALAEIGRRIEQV
jgi:uncharacterized protein with von Willebrand factor type A (vWA) domain